MGKREGEKWCGTWGVIFLSLQRKRKREKKLLFLFPDKRSFKKVGFILAQDAGVQSIMTGKVG